MSCDNDTIIEWTVTKANVPHHLPVQVGRRPSGSIGRTDVAHEHEEEGFGFRVFDTLHRGREKERREPSIRTRSRRDMPQNQGIVDRYPLPRPIEKKSIPTRNATPTQCFIDKIKITSTKPRSSQKSLQRFYQVLQQSPSETHNPPLHLPSTATTSPGAA